jgi:hypothetical protein
MAKEVPQKYIVDGLEAVSYGKLNADTEAVNFKTPKGTEFSLARDIMGIQFCASGRLWPSMRGFASMEKAITYIKKHTAEAVAFFDSIEPSESFGVIDVVFAGAFAEAGRSPS